MGKVTDFIFGRYIYRVHPSKRPLKISRKGTVGVSRDSQILGVTPYYLKTGKARDVKFGRYIDRVYVNKSPLKLQEQ